MPDDDKPVRLRGFEGRLKPLPVDLIGVVDKGACVDENKLDSALTCANGHVNAVVEGGEVPAFRQACVVELKRR